ncbi:MAG: GspH/FimT family pseudopilin [Neisseriaceae bacterium]|nr:GspH/FimT family pseudopilin [Neisseriaceae bacterium]
MKRRHLKQQGFTLTELMIVVALAAIFATLAVPNMSGMIARQRIQSQASEIANALTFAHTEAVRQGKPVFVVPAKIKTDGKLDGPTADWSSADTNAVLVFADENKTGNTAQKYDSDEDLRVVSLNAKLNREFSKESLGKALSTGTKPTNMAFTYYSNGQMRIGQIDSSNKEVTVTNPPGAIARIVIKDSKRVTKNQTSRYCEVIRADATGRASLHTSSNGKRSALTSDDFFYCQ